MKACGSSFGFGGVNAHVLLEGIEVATRIDAQDSDGWCVHALCDTFLALHC